MGRRNLRHLFPSVEEEPTINLTPLIDVVFVILIMFIVIAPLLEVDRIALAPRPHISDEKNVSAQENSPITLHVRENNLILFNNEEIALEQLGGRLRQAHRSYPKARPQLFHDKRAPFGTYQTIKNAAEGAGFEELDVILSPTE